MMEGKKIIQRMFILHRLGKENNMRKNIQVKVKVPQFTVITGLTYAQRNSWFGQEDLDSERNGYGERLRAKTELTEEAKVIEETEMEGQLVQKYQTAHWEEAVRHVFLFLPEVLVYLDRSGQFFVVLGK